MDALAAGGASDGTSSIARMALICHESTRRVAVASRRGFDGTCHLHPEEIAALEREFVEAQLATHMETASEDDEIGERMDAGRRALLERGSSDVRPYQSPLEDGMWHFHAWCRQMTGP